MEWILSFSNPHSRKPVLLVQQGRASIPVVNFIGGGGCSRTHLIKLLVAHGAMMSALDGPRFLTVGLCHTFSHGTVSGVCCIGDSSCLDVFRDVFQ